MTRRSRYIRPGVDLSPEGHGAVLWPRANYAETSREAARKIARQAPTLRDRVHAAIVSSGERGVTHQEIATTTGIWLDTVKPRVHELGELGLVVALKKPRLQRRATSARVFVAKEFAGTRELAEWPKRRIDWRALADQLKREVEELRKQIKSLSERSGS